MPVRKDGITLVDKSQDTLEFYLSLLAGASVFSGAGGQPLYGLQIAGFDGSEPRYIKTDTNGNLQIKILAETKLTPASGLASSSGNNLLVTPSTSKKLRLAYLSYNPSAAVELAFRFGVGGQLFMRNNVTVGGSIISKDFGDMKYAEGVANESLYLNLSAAVPTIWNAFYTEVF